jgi:hypothetical protein
MQQDTFADAAHAIGQPTAGETLSIGDKANYRLAGGMLVIGGIVATVFNLLFPRAENQFDTIAVLTMIAENELVRQVSFFGVTLGVWVLSAGIVLMSQSVGIGSATPLIRIGNYGIFAGATLFAVATGIGLVTTGAAVNWVASGSQTEGAEFAIASALNAADDGVWFISIIVLWSAFAVTGAGMLSDERVPRWIAGGIILLGMVNAVLIGVPLGYGVERNALFILFAVIAQLTIVWALASGIWLIRKAAQ